MKSTGGRKKTQAKRAQVNDIYEGIVVRLADHGAFINILPGRDGFVHISQIADRRIDRVSDVLREGDKVRAKVLEIDRQGRIRLTMRGIDSNEAEESGDQPGRGVAESATGPGGK